MSFLICHTITSQEHLEKTKIVKNVFKALKTQNEKPALKSLPTKKDINFLIPLVEKSRPEEHIPDTDAILADFKLKATENFEKVIKKGTAFGVEWDHIVLEDVKYESNPDKHTEIERGNLILECSSNDKQFLITLRKCYKVRDHWRLMNTIKFTLL